MRFSGLSVPQRIHDERLSVSLSGLHCKKREWVQLSRVGPNHTLGVFNSSVTVLARSLTERYYNCEVKGEFVRPLPSSHEAWDVCSSFRKKLLKRMPYCEQWDLQKTVNLYTGGKRKLYQAAYDRCKSVPPNFQKWSQLKAFAKFEKCNLAKAPRVINPRDPRYNLYLASFLKPVEHIFYHKIGKVFGSPTVMKGFNVERIAKIARAKWDRFTDPVAIGADAIKFDMHVQNAALCFEHSIYNAVFRSKLLRTILKYQLKNRGSASCLDGWLNFTIEATRCSGDLNTALGNVILMCAIIFSWIEKNVIDIELMNNGDDCVMIMERNDLERFCNGFIEHCEGLGFRMELENPVDEFEQIVFCQMSPVWNGQNWVMVRNVETCLVKDTMCLIPIQNERVMHKWLTSVSLGGLSLTAGIPVLQEFYKMYGRWGRGVRDKAMDQHLLRNTGRLFYGVGLDPRVLPITPEARVSFWKAFGMTPDQQIYTEERFRRTRFEFGDLPHVKPKVFKPQNLFQPLLSENCEG